MAKKKSKAKRLQEIAEAYLSDLIDETEGPLEAIKVWNTVNLGLMGAAWKQAQCDCPECRKKFRCRECGTISK